eukprot:m.448197 g.448197  ORF g.448197 m.448197 type:complete len:62 (+) comp56890_c0_seq6:88-273(+)
MVMTVTMPMMVVMVAVVMAVSVMMVTVVMALPRFELIQHMLGNRLRLGQRRLFLLVDEGRD